MRMFMVKVSSPDDKAVYESRGVEEGTFSIEAKSDGDYKMCLINKIIRKK